MEHSSLPDLQQSSIPIHSIFLDDDCTSPEIYSTTFKVAIESKDMQILEELKIAIEESTSDLREVIVLDVDDKLMNYCTMAIPFVEAVEFDLPIHHERMKGEDTMFEMVSSVVHLRVE